MLAMRANDPWKFSRIRGVAVNHLSLAVAGDLAVVDPIVDRARPRTVVAGHWQRQIRRPLWQAVRVIACLALGAQVDYKAHPKGLESPQIGVAEAAQAVRAEHQAGRR